MDISADYNRAYLHYLRGQYSAALEAFSRLRQEFEEAGNLRQYALCDLAESEIYLQLDLSKDAAFLAIRAAAQFEKLGMRYEHAKATALQGLALVRLRRLPEALDVFHLAQTIFEEEKNRYWIGLLDLYRADAYLSQGQSAKAQFHGIRAKATFDNLAIPSKEIFSRVLLARVAIASADVAAAQEYLAEIADIVSETKVPLVLYPYYVLRGELAERLHQRDEGVAHYESAAQELELHQARLDHDDLRWSFSKDRQQAYEALVQLSLETFDAEQALSSAFAWCERARSQHMIELLSNCMLASRAQLEPSLVSKIQRLREELNVHYTKSKWESGAMLSPSEIQGIAAKERELALTLQDASLLDPEFVSLQQVSIMTLGSVQQQLPKRTTLVEYFAIGDEVLAFIVSANGSQVARRLCSLSRVVKRHESLGLVPERLTLETMKRHLRELYQDLIAPLIDALHTPHVTIVPHGSLQFLPFHAFYDGERYVIDQFEISYAPSSSTVRYGAESPDVTGTSPLLIGVRNEELSRMEEVFPRARILRDDAATRQAFVENGKVASFVHIAADTVFSGFKLADGWFTAFDLFSSSCETNLVMLSGFQSGMNEVTGTDGLLTLIRGFLYAGARSLILNLCNGNDESKAALMIGFYRHWQSGLGKSAALRKAMLEVREEYPNPLHWAPFYLWGYPGLKKD